MNCPNCNEPIPDAASFCPACGLPVKRGHEANAPKQTRSAGAPTPTTPPVTPPKAPTTPPTTPPATPPTVPPPTPTQIQTQAGASNTRPKRWPIVVGICVALLLVAGGVTFGLVRAAMSSRMTERQIVFTIATSDRLDSKSSRIPVHVTGTDVQGNNVDQTVFLARSGVDMTLPPGSYEVSVLGSPINSDGTIFEYPKKSYSFTVDESTRADEEISVRSERVLTFVSVPAAKMTDQQIADAVQWARKDEASGADVGKLEEAAKALKRRGSSAT